MNVTHAVLAVDGGNTKTVAAVVTVDGTVLGHALGGSADVYAVGEAAAAATVTTTSLAALDQAGLAPGDVAHAACYLAGVDWAIDETFWESELSSWIPAGRVTICNDGFSLLRCASLDGHAVSIVLGTGGAIAARGPRDSVALSFWIRHPLGAYGLVWESLNAAVLAHMQVAPETVLTTLLPEAMGLPTVEDCLRALTERRSSWTFARTAGVAPRLMAAYGTDATFDSIVERMAHDTVSYVKYLIDRCGLTEPVALALGGGMTAPGSPMTSLIVTALTRAKIRATLIHDPGPAIVGVCLDALALTGIPLTPHLVTSLRRQFDLPRT